jgi:phage shock protein E
MLNRSFLRVMAVVIFLVMTSTAQTGLAQYEPVNNDEVTWIDVRSPEEFEEGHVDGAVNIHFEDIVTGVAGLGLKNDDVIYLYCGSGRRAGLAAEELKANGYSNVINIGGLEQALEASVEPPGDS